MLALPTADIRDFAAKVLAYSSYGSFALSEGLIEEAKAIVREEPPVDVGGGQGSKGEVMNTPLTQQPAGKLQVSAAVDVSALSFKELSDLREALETASEVLNGLVSQRRFEGKLQSLNPAGEVLDDFVRMFDLVSNAVVDEASKRPAHNDLDKELKLGIVAPGLIYGGATLRRLLNLLPTFAGKRNREPASGP